MALALALLVSGCSVLEGVGLKFGDVDLAQDAYKCIEKAVDAVKDQALSSDEKVDVASKAAAECSKPVVKRVLDS